MDLQTDYSDNYSQQETAGRTGLVKAGKDGAGRERQVQAGKVFSETNRLGQVVVTAGVEEAREEEEAAAKRYHEELREAMVRQRHVVYVYT